MAFFLAPRLAFTPAHCQNRSRQSVAPFFSLLDNTINEINRAAHQQAHRQQQCRYTPRFDVWESETEYNVDAEVPGFEQENIDIEVTDEHTLSIKGNSAPRVEKGKGKAPAAEESRSEKAALEQSQEAPPVDETETASTKSHQATVEDDFEDLANDSDVASTSSSSKTVENEKAAEVAAPGQQSEPEKQLQQESQEQQQRRWISERSFGSFERSFRFAGRIERDAVRASLKNGILNIVVPKAPVPEVRHIEIQ